MVCSRFTDACIFAQVAAAYAEDKAATGGNLGWMTRGSMVCVSIEPGVVWVIVRCRSARSRMQRSNCRLDQNNHGDRLVMMMMMVVIMAMIMVMMPRMTIVNLLPLRWLTSDPIRAAEQEGDHLHRSSHQDTARLPHHCCSPSQSDSMCVLMMTM